MDLVVRLLSFTALAGLAFIPLERLYGARRGPRRDRLTDAGFATHVAKPYRMSDLIGAIHDARTGSAQERT